MSPESPLDATGVAHRTFSSVRRGYDPSEVRSFVRELAARLERLEAECAALRQRTDAAERGALSEHLDHHGLVELVGEETARVLDAARAAAADIRSKAEESAARLVQQGHDDARAVIAQAEQDAAARKAEILAEAEQVRQEAGGELDRRREEATDVAGEIRRAAETERDRLVAQGEEARLQAEADAARIREAAREEAGQLVAEAQTVRERLLGDLARRRRAAREQLERLNAARERLLAAYAVVRRTVEEATTEMTVALPEAKVAGEAARRRVKSEAEATIEQLEAELSAARMAGLLEEAPLPVYLPEPPPDGDRAAAEPPGLPADADHGQADRAVAMGDGGSAAGAGPVSGSSRAVGEGGTGPPVPSSDGDGAGVVPGALTAAARGSPGGAGAGSAYGTTGGGTAEPPTPTGDDVPALPSTPAARHGGGPQRGGPHGGGLHAPAAPGPQGDDHERAGLPERWGRWPFRRRHAGDGHAHESAPPSPAGPRGQTAPSPHHGAVGDQAPTEDEAAGDGPPDIGDPSGLASAAAPDESSAVVPGSHDSPVVESAGPRDSPVDASADGSAGSPAASPDPGESSAQVPGPGGPQRADVGAFPRPGGESSTGRTAPDDATPVAGDADAGGEGSPARPPASERPVAPVAGRSGGNDGGAVGRDAAGDDEAVPAGSAMTPRNERRDARGDDGALPGGTGVAPETSGPERTPQRGAAPDAVAAGAGEHATADRATRSTGTVPPPGGDLPRDRKRQSGDERSPGGAPPSRGDRASLSNLDELFARIRAGRSPADGADGSGAGTPPAKDRAGTVAAVVDVPPSPTLAGLPAEAPAGPGPGAAGGDARPADAPGPGPGTAPSDAATAADQGGGGRVDGEAEPEARDAALLRDRDAELGMIERSLARRLKRVLADEQNEVFDLLRRSMPDASDDLFPGRADHVRRYADAATVELDAAAGRGAAAIGAGRPRSCGGLAAELGGALVDPMRERVARALSDSGGEPDEATSRLRALYREWKGQRIGDLARHYTAAAYATGLFDAAPPGAELRWLVDRTGEPCPDADDNALAGGVRKGDQFPTGDRCPPAHPGCRCLAVPVALPGPGPADAPPPDDPAAPSGGSTGSGRKRSAGRARKAGGVRKAGSGQGAGGARKAGSGGRRPEGGQRPGGR